MGRLFGEPVTITVPLAAVPSVRANLSTFGKGRSFAELTVREERFDGNPPQFVGATLRLGAFLAPAKSKRPVCGATTRKGTPCQARAYRLSKRCRLHGGMSTGPKTEAGKAAIVASNRRRVGEKRKRKAV